MTKSSLVKYVEKLSCTTGFAGYIDAKFARKATNYLSPDKKKSVSLNITSRTDSFK